MNQKNTIRKTNNIALELRRHDLTFRELQIAELIMDKTLGWQRQEIIIPQLRFFTDLTGIAQSDVVKVLKTLHARRVIRIRKVKSLPTYSLNLDSESWKAMPRVSLAAIQEANNLLRECNGLPVDPVYSGTGDFPDLS